MGNSIPCQICVVGFLIGVCLTSLFLAALLTSLGTFAFGGISFSKFSNGITSWSSSSDIIKTEKVIMYSQQTSEDNIDERVSFLYSAWSALLDESTKGEGELPQGADQIEVALGKVSGRPNTPTAAEEQTYPTTRSVVDHQPKTGRNAADQTVPVLFSKNPDTATTYHRCRCREENPEQDHH
ncbi:hypothetical protein RHGRI_027258 [Rhododendron griersonianum]|uniref:Uncharacterized protein n=1 Tax=Rhododendron griersonianum TaxID=479676 RepID=A0AAV6IVZ4_9ERIC|nr:hypothetical protein RHGRI_027258 [Rhododendron griersonianum]